MTTDSKDANTEILSYLWTPEIEPLFWREQRTQVDTTAWCGHIPFAHWIVGAAQPRVLVELGTHQGVSYSAFCEAVARHNLKTECYAVDTWKGDDQAGHYGEEVYDEFRRFHDERYSRFSKLLRCTFDEALSYISDSSVDLLHIDGLHTYEAVRHDFEAWYPKLSEKGVVLFHDTNVREGDFGVWRLWEELRTQFASFEFLHSYGLGVLAVGPEVTALVAALCSLTDPGNVMAVRDRFSFFGENSFLRSRCENLTRDLASAALPLKVAEEARAAAEERARQAVLERDQVLGSLTWRIAQPFHRLIRLFPLSMRTSVYNALASVLRVGSKGRKGL
jgi:O-antigen biosynthesis protein